MKNQMKVSEWRDELAQMRTNKKEFLEWMERLIPWGEWKAVIEPRYYKGERGNKPYDLEFMLRLFVVQNLYSLSDMAMRNEAIDSRAFSEFCGTNRTGQIPDRDTIGRFRRPLEKHGIQEKLFAQVRELLIEKGLLLKKGTIVDSTFIEAPFFDEKPGKKARYGGSFGQKGERMAFWLQVAYWRGQKQRTGSHNTNDRREYK